MFGERVREVRGVLGMWMGDIECGLSVCRMAKARLLIDGEGCLTMIELLEGAERK